MSKLIEGFFSFVREQGVVGMAVALAIGIQASQTVSAIVNQFVNPLVGVILMGTDLTGIQSEVEVDGDTLVFGWGIILQSIITLLATALVIYFVVDKLGLTKADKKKK
jgi:large conductance mechanosensitive channel